MPDLSIRIGPMPEDKMQSELTKEEVERGRELIKEAKDNTCKESYFCGAGRCELKSGHNGKHKTTITWGEP